VEVIVGLDVILGILREEFEARNLLDRPVKVINSSREVEHEHKFGVDLVYLPVRQVRTLMIKSIG
jgi:hypothetical protein